MAETVSLKALARLVLARDSERDSSRDRVSRRSHAAEALPRQSASPVSDASPGGPILFETKLLAPLLWFERVAPPVEGEPLYEKPCIARRGKVEERDGVLLHFCTECGAWGAFGYGVGLRAGRAGRWYCATHRPRGRAA